MTKQGRLLLGAVLAVISCRRTQSAPVPDGSPEGGATTVAPSARVPLAPRCKVATTGPLLSQGGGEIEVGDAFPFGDRVAVGFVRRAARDATAGVALVGTDLSANEADVGLVRGDDPAPKPFALGPRLFAAGITRSRGDAGPAAGGLSWFRIDGARVSTAAVTALPHDDSPAFDVAAGESGALAAWEEVATGTTRGLVKVAAFDGDHAELVVPVSPDATDADAPQVAVRTGGYWVSWMAHRPEAAPEGVEAGPQIEAPGEGREYRWVEILAVDASGKPAGAPRRVTLATSHVSAYALVARSDGDLDVIVADPEETREGAGGRIVRVVVQADAIEAPVVLLPEGVGRGAPAAIAASSGSAPWLTFSDLTDHVGLLPLGAFTPDPSVEPSLEDARPLAILGQRLLAIRGKGGRLVAMECGTSASPPLAPLP